VRIEVKVPHDNDGLGGGGALLELADEGKVEREVQRPNCYPMHPIEKGKGFIALFRDRKQGSTFHQILTNHPNWQFRAPLSAKQLLRSRYDLRLYFIARQIHAAGEIRGHRVHWMPGKLEVTLWNGQSRNFSDPASFLQTASQVTCNLVRKKDRQGRPKSK
jgi:hypothetical protein